MPSPQQPSLTPGSYYHIYNRSNGSENLFGEKADYQHFLNLYDKFITPIGDTLAWVLMANHFHVLVRIKEGMVYKYSKADFQKASPKPAVRFEDVKWETVPAPQTLTGPPVGGRRQVVPDPTRHFSHLFNAYTKYINKKYQRNGSLFQRPFKRKLINNNNYLRQAILYIHNNPVHHGFVDYPFEYPWSSFNACISDKPTHLSRNSVMALFVNDKDFKQAHGEKVDFGSWEDWLEIYD